MGRTVKLSEYKDKRRDEGSIEIIGENGETFIIEPPELWPDEAQAMASAGDNLGLVRLILGGDTEYDRFVAAGGNAASLAGIIQDNLGATPGKSPASSSS